MTLTAGVHADLFDKAACGKPGHELGSMILGRDDIPGRRRVPAGDNHPYARFIYPKFSSLEKSDPLKSAEIGGLLLRIGIIALATTIKEQDHAYRYLPAPLRPA